MAVKKKTPVTRARAPSSGGQSTVVSMVEWLIYLIVAAIPIVGLVMCFVWAFRGGNLNRRNYFRAALIFMAALIVLGIIFSVILHGFFEQFFELFRGI